MNKFKLMLVDDHALVRAGIKSLIDHLDGFVVVAEASGIAEAMGKLANPVPDIVITDIDMGIDNGLDLVRKIKKQMPEALVVILSMHSSEALVSEALQLGASAYLLKEAVPAELEIALRAVTHGETFLSPAVATKMINRFVRPAVPAAAAADPLKSLTLRQVQILTMLASGRGTKEIAYELDLSNKTVAAHRAQIMERLGIHDLVGLVLFAVKHGLVKIDKP